MGDGNYAERREKKLASCNTVAYNGHTGLSQEDTCWHWTVWGR